MVTWKAFEEAEPSFAGRVQELMGSGRHRTIATIRRDGSPRISGIECEIADGELRFGSMPDSRKGADLSRDPRFALHSATVDPVNGEEAAWPGEAKVSGRAILAQRVGDGAAGPPGDMFVADIHEVVITRLNDKATRLVIESWSVEGGFRRTERT